MVHKHRPSWSPTWIHWRLATWGVSDRYLIYAGGLMSPMQSCFSDLVIKAMASWRRLPGRPRKVWLNKVQEDANALLLSMLWTSEIARSHGAAQRFTRSTRRRRRWWWWWRMTCQKMEGKTNFSRQLQAVLNRDCWVFENHWRRCNQKQFDVEADRKRIFHFRP